MAVEQLGKMGEAQIARLFITPSSTTKKPKGYFDSDDNPRILGIDWMTLAGLRSSSNWVGSYDSPDETLFAKTLAITTPPQLTSWFTQAGFILVDKIILNNAKNHVLLNEYFSHHNCLVVSLVSSKILPKGDGPNLPNHWVVWSSTLKDSQGNLVTTATKPNEIVNMEVFSWGENNMRIKPITYTVFKAYHHMALVFR